MNSDYFFLAFRTLWKRKLRSSLTLLGIIIAIATIFVLISISIGLQDAVREQFRQLGTDKFFIFPRGQLAGPGAGGATEFTISDVNIIDKVVGVKDLSYAVVGNAKIEFGGQIRYVQVLGIPTDRGNVFIESGAYKVEEGRYLREGDREVVALGSQYSKGIIFNKEIHVGNTLIINGLEFNVRASMSEKGNPGDDKIILMPLEDFKELFKSGDRIDQVIVQTDSINSLNEVAERVEKKLRNMRHVTEKTQDFTILTPEEFLATFGAILGILTSFLLGIAGISLLVGSIGIATTMFTSVLERTREIGTMKAVGARNGDILTLFLIESGLLGLIGGALGVFFGYSVAKTIEFIATKELNTTLLQAAAPPFLVFGCLIFAFLIGAISGIIPAWHASKLKAVDALRYE